jgi:TPR repeat protein
VWFCRAADQKKSSAKPISVQYKEHGLEGLSLNTDKAFELYLLAANQGDE